jgi:hypothetical protein
MSGKPSSKTAELLSVSDPLAETGEKLEAMRQRLAEDMEDRKIEFERLKEETLWRLNAMSDRTIEIAHLEEEDVKERLAGNREEAESELAVWKERLHERLCDKNFLDVLDVWVEDAFDQLLPSLKLPSLKQASLEGASDVGSKGNKGGDSA